MTGLTLPETNSKSGRKWIVGFLVSFWGKQAIFRGKLAVSFREGNIYRNPLRYW